MEALKIKFLNREVGLALGPAAIVPAVLGAGGLLLQSKAQSDAKKAQEKSQKSANALTQRQAALFDDLRALYQTGVDSGQFNPESLLKQLGTDTEYYQGLSNSNNTAAARALGYRPGDSVPVQKIQATNNQYRLQYGQLANQIRQNAFANQFNTLNSIQSGVLNPGIQYHAGMAQQAGASQQGYNPANAFASIFAAMNQGGGQAKVNVGGLTPPPSTNYGGGDGAYWGSQGI